MRLVRGVITSFIFLFPFIALFVAVFGRSIVGAPVEREFVRTPVVVVAMAPARAASQNPTRHR